MRKVRIASVVAASLMVTAALFGPQASAKTDDGIVSSAVQSRIAKVGRAERRANGPRLRLDDGTAEQVIGVADSEDQTKGLQAVVANVFTPDPAVLPLTINRVMVLFPKGMTFEVVVYLDPTGSLDPDNAELATRQTFALKPSDTRLQKVTLDNPVTVEQGDVWVGYINSVTGTNPEFIFHAALDTTNPKGRSWIFYNRAGSSFTGDRLANAQFQRQVNEPDFNGNWIIRAAGQTGQGVAGL
jgi:hypothetical protein